MIVFLKAPEPGKVKTRLSRFLDPDFVLDLYKGFVEDIFEVLKGEQDVCVFFWPPEKKNAVRRWFKNEAACFPQKGENLGKRMGNAFQNVFSRGYETAVLMGTDIPEISREILSLARKILETSDAVVGPTADGGYYLIGFKQSSFSYQYFKKIDWSTRSVLDQTLCAMQKGSIRCKLLPRLHDIDTPEDLKALADRVKSGVKIGKRIRKLLRGYGG